MSTQPEALRLADALNDWSEGPDTSVVLDEAAAELRRLHAQRDALLDVLKQIAGAALRADNLMSDMFCLRLRPYQMQLSRKDRFAELVAVAANTAPQQEVQEPVAWGAFYFGGRRNGKLYSHCDTQAQIEAYIADRHQSDDSNTFRAAPLYTAPPQRHPHRTVTYVCPVCAASLEKQG